MHGISVCDNVKVMAKFSLRQKLSRNDEEKLLIEFCKAIVELKTPIEAAHFIKDLLSKQEARMLAKRIAIARFLIEGDSYESIRHKLIVSYGTIARVNQWLQTSGEGYRLIIKRVGPEKSAQQEFIEEMEKPVSWKQIKKRHSIYFWPELLLEEIVKSAKKRQKEQLRTILGKFDDKSELFEKLDGLLKEEYKIKQNSHTT